MDDLKVLAEMRAEIPADARYPAAHKALVAEIAGTGRASSARRRSVRGSVVVSGVVAGAVAAGTVVVALNPGDDRHTAPAAGAPSVPAVGNTSLPPLRLAAVTSPMTLARNATMVAQRAPVPAPTQWVYIKENTAISHAPPSGAMPMEPGSHRIRETWTRVDMRYTASLRGGKPVVTSTNGGLGNPIGWPAITYSYLNALPTDPGALLAVIKRNIVSTSSYRVLGGHGEDAVFDSVLALVENYPVLPAKLNAALYGVLARLKVVRLGHRVDNAGRRVLSLDHVEDDMRSSILIDQSTYKYAGQQRVQVRDSSRTGLDGTLHFRKGEIFANEAVLVSKIVNAPGARG